MSNSATPRQAALDAFAHRVHECSTAGCQTLIATGTHCRKHQVPPAEGAWIIAAGVFKDERGEDE